MLVYSGFLCVSTLALFFTLGFVVVVEPFQYPVSVIALFVLVPDDFCPPVLVDAHLSVGWR